MPDALCCLFAGHSGYALCALATEVSGLYEGEATGDWPRIPPHQQRNGLPTTLSVSLTEYHSEDLLQCELMLGRQRKRTIIARHAYF